MIAALDIPTPAPEILNPIQEPTNRHVCDCGRNVDWVWYDALRRHPHNVAAQSFRSRWVPEMLSPCRSCIMQTAIDKRKEHLRLLQKGAGIPFRYRDLRWANVSDYENDMTIAKWMRECKADGSIGVYGPNEAAACELLNYTIKDGSVYLFGSVGCGKTAFASVTATRLMDRSGEVLEHQTLKGFLTRDNGPSLRFITDEELDAEIKASWNTRNADDPVLQYAECDLLIWDDLGTLTTSKPLNNGRERLIDMRYRHDRPIIFTSNVRMAELEHVLSPRIASRVEEMVGKRNYELMGDDWRSA